MSNSVIQTSFNAGEWAPTLYARVDLAKYHNGAALLRNFFVDYRGGASTRPGTRFIAKTFLNSTVRLIPFQASFGVSYVLEFGQAYIRFYNNGSPVLEAAKAITAINIGTSTITVPTHGYSNGDWIFIDGAIVGTVGAQLTGNYFIIAGATANTFTLTDLNGVAIVFSGTYTSGGTTARVYTIGTSYTSAELAGIKFAQNVNFMVLCHPNHPPSQLTLISANNWTFGTITFGTTVGTPAFISATTTLPAGNANYSYTCTAVDANGQESNPATPIAIPAHGDIRAILATNTLTISAPAGQVSSFNMYEAELSYTGAVPGGAAYGFIGNFTGTVFNDSNITPDFAQSAPVPNNPFFGSGVQSIALTANAFYTSVPTVGLAAPPAGGVQATAQAYLILNPPTTPIVLHSSGSFYSIGDVVTIGGSGAKIVVTATGGGLGITAFNVISYGNPVLAGPVPTNPQNSSVSGGPGSGAQFDQFWQIGAINLTQAGSGYLVAPAVTISGAATATSTLGAAGAGNPTVPGFHQQRLSLMGPVSSPMQINYSQPGAYYNFNLTNPIQADNAIQATLVSGQLNTIQSVISQPQGQIIFGDKLAWLVNGGSPGAPISALAIAANPQVFVGAAAVPPIVAGDNILYVQSKGSIVRNLVFNFYAQVYTGTDISILSSHLFYGFQILEWAWAEEPFKVVWAVRNDGTLLSLTFLKEQELIAWAHSDTNGLFKSIATVTETTPSGAVDAIYTVVQRTINGNQVQYIERMSELYTPGGATDSWAVDAGIQFNGTSTLTFSGAQHLAAATVTGLATDNLGNVTVITPFTMPTTGTFTLPAPTPVGATGYTRVTVGLAFLPQLQTLPLDVGEPTIQGKRKKIAGVTLRVKDALGLSMGRDTTTLQPLQDLILGNVGSMTNQLVTNLVTGDVRGYMDPLWDVPGQYLIQQPLPYPATILGVIPEIVIGDTVK